MEFSFVALLEPFWEEALEDFVFFVLRFGLDFFSPSFSSKFSETDAEREETVWDSLLAPDFVFFLLFCTFFWAFFFASGFSSSLVTLSLLFSSASIGGVEGSGG